MNGNWTRATWWYNACLVMQRYFAAVSMSSQRGSMVGLVRVMGWRSSSATSTGGMTSLGSIGSLSNLSRGVVGEDVVRGAMRRRLACGPEPPSGSAALLTAMALSRGYLESARATGFTGGNLAAEQVETVSFGSVPPRRSAQDGASGEESMLPLDSLGVNARRSLANHGN
jgi:hypothetical protein